MAKLKFDNIGGEVQFAYNDAWLTEKDPAKGKTYPYASYLRGEFGALKGSWDKIHGMWAVLSARETCRHITSPSTALKPFGFPNMVVIGRWAFGKQKPPNILNRLTIDFLASSLSAVLVRAMMLTDLIGNCKGRQSEYLVKYSDLRSSLLTIALHSER